MKKTDEIFKNGGFYCKDKHLFDGFEDFCSKQNLLEQEVQLPCTRVVNGFRLVPRFVSDEDKRIIWCIRPNRSDFTFYFSSLLFATQFARKFVNRHTQSFWFRLFSPIYSIKSAISNLKIF